MVKVYSPSSGNAKLTGKVAMVGQPQDSVTSVKIASPRFKVPVNPGPLTKNLVFN